LIDGFIRVKALETLSSGLKRITILEEVFEIRWVEEEISMIDVISSAKT
jgi:hypothetical protein